MKISYVPCHIMGAILHVAVDGRYAGHIVISDVIKPHARQAIAALKRNGIKQTVMLTGDTRRTAENIAKDVGVDQVYSELLPVDKVNKVEQLLARKGEKEKLAFLLSRKCLRIVYENIVLHWG